MEGLANQPLHPSTTDSHTPAVTQRGRRESEPAAATTQRLPSGSISTVMRLSPWRWMTFQAPSSRR